MRLKVCESCGSEPACFVIRRSFDDDIVSERGLCAGCARDIEMIMFGGDLLLTELLSAAGSASCGIENEKSACPVCGNTLLNVRKTGMMGCVTCYESFRAQIVPIISEIHSYSFSAHPNY